MLNEHAVVDTAERRVRVPVDLTGKSGFPNAMSGLVLGTIGGANPCGGSVAHLYWREGNGAESLVAFLYGFGDVAVSFQRDGGIRVQEHMIPPGHHVSVTLSGGLDEDDQPYSASYTFYNRGVWERSSLEIVTGNTSQ